MDTGLAILFLALITIPSALTATMFLSKSNRAPLLGFPSGIFWFVVGVYSYTQATTRTWDNIYYILFWAFGIVMTLFTILAAIALWTTEQRSVEPEEPPQDRPDTTVDDIDRGDNSSRDRRPQGRKDGNQSSNKVNAVFSVEDKMTPAQTPDREDRSERRVRVIRPVRRPFRW